MRLAQVFSLMLLIPLAGCGAAAADARETTPPPPPEGAARASEPFRQEHEHLIAKLDAVARIAETLRDVPEPERAAKVHEVVHFFKHVLAPHAEVEEAVLYSYVDRTVGAPSPFRYTDTMRHDHTVVARTIGQLDAFMRAGDLSPEGLHRFQAQSIGLLGLVRAHFEAEEDVLLAALDARVTRAAFVQNVMEPSEEWMRAHGHAH